MSRAASEPSGRRDDAVVFGAALAARLAVAAWAFSRVPPYADGVYYDVLAQRIAAGQGYTWLWPDGAVTAAGHYPVGLPALGGALYRVAGHHPGLVPLAIAVLGALAAPALRRFVARDVGRKAGLWAGLGYALHPGLLAYVPAYMTEGLTAALVAFALGAVGAATHAATPARRWLALGALGVLLGVATYVRPQSILLAPLLAWIAWPGARGTFSRRAAAAAVTLGVALAVVAPWTLRNCDQMGRCALVSVNGGWNLLIGTDVNARGTWAELAVPPACRTVYDEAEKDACFGRAAREAIRAAPLPWLALAPAKLGATFDYVGAGPWYVHAASPAAFPARVKVVVGALETAFERLVLGAGLFVVARELARGAGRWARWAGPVGAALALLPAGWVGVALLTLGALVAALRAPEPLPRAFGAVVGVVGSTILVHVGFFGAGRYALPTFPALVALAALAVAAPGARRAPTF